MKNPDITDLFMHTTMFNQLVTSTNGIQIHLNQRLSMEDYLQEAQGTIKQEL